MSVAQQKTLADFYELPDRDIFTKAGPFYRFLQETREQGHYLYRRTIVGSSANRVRVRDEAGRIREMVMMASNNYLGLTNHPKVVEAGIRAYEKYGAGAGSVSLLAGTMDLHLELEHRLANFKGCEDAIVFPAGYSTNVGCISGLARQGDLVLNDVLNHASIIDGSRLSGATVKVFPHRNMRALNLLLDRHGREYQGKLIVVDGVFSMDGDIAPLPELVEVARRHGARIMVDEAHATGVLGAHGRGTPEHFGLEGKIDIVMGTLSKALGGIGGFVASSREVVDYLRFFGRAYMFSTALPPAATASVLAALEVVEKEPEIRERLWHNINFLSRNLREIGFDLGHSETAIIPLLLRDDWKVKEMARLLHERGVFVNPVFYPAVSRKLARIRLSVMATHTQEDLDLTVEACAEVGRQLGVIP